MRTASIIARYLAGVIFLVFGLNGFLNFIPMPSPGGIAGQFMGALYASHYLWVIFAFQRPHFGPRGYQWGGYRDSNIFPQYRYTLTSEVQTMHNVAICRWGSGMLGQPFHYTGTDFLEERDGRTSRLTRSLT